MTVSRAEWYTPTLRNKNATTELTKNDYGHSFLFRLYIAGALLLINLPTTQIVGLKGQAFPEGILVAALETFATNAIGRSL